MAVKSMETAEEATASMEMAPGALPLPGRVPEQRLLSPEICLRRWRHCGTILGKTPILLGFSFRRIFIGGGAASEGHQGGLTTPGHGQEGGAPAHGEGALWPPSDSLSVLVLRPGKIGVSVFVSSNFENISCVAFLKHKTAENRKLALWHLLNRLVPEIA
jgi:hypothetical protein